MACEVIGGFLPEVILSLHGGDKGVMILPQCVVVAPAIIINSKTNSRLDYHIAPKLY